MKEIFAYGLMAVILLSCNQKDTLCIYMVGDSTMSVKKPEVAPETGWGMVLSAFFDDAVIIKNHAKNGRSTKSFIVEGRWINVLDSLTQGDFVLIQFGHNDQKHNSPERYTKPYGDYYRNLKKFVIESRQKGATPILLTSIVRRKFSEDGQLIDTHGDYPKAMRKVAEDLNVGLVDLQKLTHHLVDSLGSEKSKVLYVWTKNSDLFPEGRQDDTHLSVQGAEKVAALAVQELRKLNGDLKQHIVNHP